MLELLSGPNSTSINLSTDSNAVSQTISPPHYPAIASSLNYQLNPCDNFYEFVCDGWTKSHTIDEDKVGVSHFSVMSDKIEQDIRDVLESDHEPTLPPYDGMMHALYNACMDTDARKSDGSSILLKTMLELKHSKEIRFITDWLISVFPITLFYGVAVGPDYRDSSRNIISVSPAVAFLGSEKYYLEEGFAPVIASLRRYLRQVLLFLADDDKGHEIFSGTEAEIERRIDSFMQVEAAIATIQNISDRHFDNAYADDMHMTVQELHDTLAPTINWHRYAQAFLPEEVLDSFGGDIPSMMVHVQSLECIRKLEHLSRNLSAQVLSDLLDWRIILNYANFLDDRFLEARFELDRSMQGAESRAPKWEECRTAATIVFTPLVERIFIQRTFKNVTREQITSIFNNVHDAFQEMLLENTWMDEATKLEALKKLATSKLHVGYMDNIFNDTKLRKDYAQLTILPNMSFSKMVMNAIGWSVKQNLLQLLEPVEINFDSFSVNGFYYALGNAIVVTAGMLQGAFYNESLPMAMNYGSIGSVIAHEVTHGYDTTGRLHDEKGNVRDWWRNETARNFIEKKQCFIDQYDNVVDPDGHGLHVNGELTQSENIADNGGIRAAFKAMLRAQQDNPAPEPEVPGLEQYSPKQLFFLNYAYSWCSKQREESAVYNLLNDNHAPPQSRVNVVLGNMPQFAEAFNCPLGSQMNPVKKCVVW
ncbi:Protein NEP-1 [Aphelenchoides avenae]|nr:Protein NEP-1 [Aphelenchus avenae]